MPVHPIHSPTIMASTNNIPSAQQQQKIQQQTKYDPFSDPALFGASPHAFTPGAGAGARSFVAQRTSAPITGARGSLLQPQTQSPAAPAVASTSFQQIAAQVHQGKVLSTFDPLASTNTAPVSVINQKPLQNQAAPIPPQQQPFYSVRPAAPAYSLPVPPPVVFAQNQRLPPQHQQQQSLAAVQAQIASIQLQKHSQQQVQAAPALKAVTQIPVSSPENEDPFLSALFAPNVQPLEQKEGKITSTAVSVLKNSFSDECVKDEKDEGDNKTTMAVNNNNQQDDTSVAPISRSGSVSSSASLYPKSQRQQGRLPGLSDVSSGPILTRISLRTLIGGQWQDSYFVFENERTLRVYRTKEDYEQYPAGSRVKREINLSGAYKVTPPRRKEYPKFGFLHHFSVSCDESHENFKFASPKAEAIANLHKKILAGIRGEKTR